MTALAKFLPDFSEDAGPLDDAVDDFFPFEVVSTERHVWQDLFIAEEASTLPDAAGVDAVAAAQDFADENCESEVAIPDQQKIDHQPTTATITVEEHDGIVSDLEQHYEDQLDELKQACGAWLSRDLDELKSLATEQLTRDLETAVARALTPFAQKALADSAAKQLVSEITPILFDKSKLKARLVGPKILIESVLDLLEGDAEHLATEISDRSELILEADGMIMRTTIVKWAERLDSILNA